MLDWKSHLFPEPVSFARQGEDNFFPKLYRGEAALDVVLITQLFCVTIVIAKSGLSAFDWDLLGLVSLLGTGMALSGALVLTICEQFFSRSSPVRSVLLSWFISFIVVVVCTVIAEQVMIFAFPGRLFSITWVAETVATAVLPMTILLRYLYVHQQVRVQAHAAKESDIQAHQARIRPHFLFNTMNVIASLIASNPEQAERAVEDVSDLFRNVLTGSQTLIPLREELSLCRQYLALEKMRLGDRLETEWQISDYGDDVKIPCLTLQPVLENAVYHGIQLIQNGGKIEIKISRLQDRILIDVRNPRNPRIQHNKGRKMAIKNVQYRLKAHFGPTAGVESEVMENYYTTHIAYPVKG